MLHTCEAVSNTLQDQVQEADLVGHTCLTEGGLLTAVLQSMTHGSRAMPSAASTPCRSPKLDHCNNTQAQECSGEP